MMRAFRTGLAVAAAFFCLLPSSAVAEIQPQQVISPGGIEAWLVARHDLPVIALSFEFRGGATDDPTGREGLAYLVSTLLDEGAGDMDSRAFQTALDERAIRIGFDAGRDQFGGQMQVLAENADTGFHLLGLALLHPRFDMDAIQRMKDAVSAGLRQDKENPATVANDAVRETIFPGHPYGRPAKGTEESIAAITRDDLVAFVEGRFARDNLIIGVVGDVTPEELGYLLDAAFLDLPEEAIPHRVLKVKPKLTPRVDHVQMDLTQSTARFVLPGLTRNDPDWYTALVLNHILGGGTFTSRLMNEVRNTRGLAYSISTYLLPYETTGILYGAVATRTDRMPQTIAVTEQVIRHLAAEGPTPEELQLAKDFLTRAYPLSFTTRMSTAEQLVGIQRYQLGMSYLQNRNRYIEAVTPQQVQRVARRLLQPDSLFWVVVGRPLPSTQSTGPAAADGP